MSITMVETDILEARIQECLTHNFQYGIEKNILLWASSKVALDVYRTRKNAYLPYVCAYAYEQFCNVIIQDSDIEAMINRVLTFIASLVFDPLTAEENKMYEESVIPYLAFCKGKHWYLAFNNGKHWYCPSDFIETLNTEKRYAFMRHIAYEKNAIDFPGIKEVYHEDSFQYETDHNNVPTIRCHVCKEILNGYDPDDDF